MPVDTSRDEKVLKKVGKAPKTAGRIAEQLGFDSHHSISRSVNRLVADGKIEKLAKGYVKK